MKRYYIFTLIVLLCSCIQEQMTSFPEISSTNQRTIKNESYYWYRGEKIPLYETSNKVFAILDKTSTAELYDPVTRSISAESLNTKPYHSSNKIFKTDGHPENIIWAKVDKDIVIANASNILYSAPYFFTETGNEIGVTNYFLIQLKSSNDYDILDQFAVDNNVTIVDRNERSLWNTLACGSRTTENALQLANKAYESGLFSATDIVFENDLNAAENPDYSDLYYSQQWSLTGTYGINFNRTHSITTGHPSIKVAVIDNGFQLDHPDMPIVSSNSWDATSQSSPAKQYLYNGKTYNNHGTGVASIIGADTNNEIGIAGIAPDITLLPISVDFSISIMDTTSHNPLTSLSNAIEHAISSGADVINNSWSCHALHPALDFMIEQALDNGRNGNGCVVVFASGNDSSNVTLSPAIQHDDIIIVGGSDSLGKRRTSSNYSDKLDLIAPGGDIPILADKGAEDYESGTSFAAPHVSAVAGLILSVNPALTRQQVSDIIEITARKLPDYTFSDTEGRTNGKWNQEVGYGLLNAMDAVSYAKGYYNLASFEYSGQDVSLTLTANKDIAVIWDWETEDITEIEASSLTTRTIEHTYTTSGTRRIYIAEKIDFDTDTLSYNSTALVKFDLTTGNYASNFEFKPHNTALEYIRIIGGSNFVSQTVSIKELPALKDLYLVHMPNAIVTIAHCPSLLRFGSSKYIWEASSSIFPIPITPISPGFEKPLDPDVVGDGPVEKIEWPYVPEPIVSYGMLSITDCNNLKEVSLENVNIGSFDFSDFPYLEYVYVSSQSHRIVGGGSNVLSPSCNGEFLASTVSTLPQRTINRKGKIAVRGVDSTNGLFKKVWISSQNQSLIEETCSDKNWEVVWDSGITNTGM